MAEHTVRNLLAERDRLKVTVAELLTAAECALPIVEEWVKNGNLPNSPSGCLNVLREAIERAYTEVVR